MENAQGENMELQFPATSRLFPQITSFNCDPTTILVLDIKIWEGKRLNKSQRVITKKP